MPLMQVLITSSPVGGRAFLCPCTNCHSYLDSIVKSLQVEDRIQLSVFKNLQ